MKKILLIIIATLFKQYLFGQGGFSKNYFPPASYVSVCTDAIEAPNGNIIMTGLTFDSPMGTNRLSIIGADAQGNQLWQKNYGSDKFEYLDDIAGTRSLINGNNCFYLYSAVRDSNNKYLSVFVKFNYTGDTLWQKKYYDPNDYLYIQSVTKSIDNGFLMTGIFDDPINPNRTALLIKTDLNGNELWRKKINKASPNIQAGNSLIQDSLTKKIVIAGYQDYTFGVIIVTDSLGIILQRKTYSGGCGSVFSDLAQTRDKKCVAVGQNDQCNNLSGPNGTPRNKGYAIKFDLNNLNNIIWYKEFDTLSVYNSLNTVNELSNGDLIFGGRYDTLLNYNISEKVMLRVIKLNESGLIKWKKNFSRDNSNVNSKFIKSLNVTSNGSYLTANWLYFANNPTPFSITKIDSMGCDSTVAYCQTVGFEEYILNNELFNIYPNPTYGLLHIETEHAFSENSKFRIQNILGQTIFEGRPGKELDLNYLKKGIYFLKFFEKENLIATKKIIKE